MSRFFLPAFILCAFTVAATADDHDTSLRELIAEAKRNPLAADGTWLEIRNVVNEWEKVVLIFGYMNDYSACESILGFVSAQNPDRSYRCNPVN